MATDKIYPVTPDKRYFVVRGRLWRLADPALSDPRRQELVNALMDARRAVASARRRHDEQDEAEARAIVQKIKVALGERGPVWWEDGAADYNRHLVRNSPYAGWFADLTGPKS